MPMVNSAHLNRRENAGGKHECQCSSRNKQCTVREQKTLRTLRFAFPKQARRTWRDTLYFSVWKNTQYIHPEDRKLKVGFEEDLPSMQCIRCEVWPWAVPPGCDRMARDGAFAGTPRFSSATAIKTRAHFFRRHKTTIVCSVCSAGGLIYSGAPRSSWQLWACHCDAFPSFAEANACRTYMSEGSPTPVRPTQPFLVGVYMACDPVWESKLCIA
ncbi:hypothetical protein LY78DRAFT_199740 [Colletotrichum sublineola]|nr:hypothetical protein LY78DRAFT_199740 [Colletotrichum sublineola]